MVIKRYAAKSRATPKPSVFISKWDTTQPGSANDTVVLPFSSNGFYNFYIDWGDGNRNNITAHNQSEVTHQYAQTGIYEIKIIGGITGWYFGGGGDGDKILNISNWGPMDLRFNDAFNGCSNLDITATDGPKVSLNNFTSIFRGCNQLTNIGSWDTSSATTFSSMFEDCTGFNQYIGDWDTSNVIDMQRMFRGNAGATTFDQDIGNWDVGNVTNFFTFMYNGSSTSAFNNGGSPSISGWDMSSVTRMDHMFNNCTGFNQPIGNWNTSKVTNMFYALNGCSSFDQDLGGWDVTGVINFSSFFVGCNSFNNGGSTGINNWRPSSCTNMSSMFKNISGFNQPIGDWDTSSVTNMREMFRRDAGGMTFDQDIGNWDVGNVTDFYTFMYGGSSPNAFTNGGSPSISGWDTSSATSMDYMFYRCTGFNQPIGNWNTSKVTNMFSMLNYCSSFDQDLGGWDVTGVTNFSSFFAGCNSFNNGGSTGINNWRPSSCTNMSSMFKNITAFNQPIGDWDTSSVTSMREMFRRDAGGMTFDQDIGNWDVGNVTDFFTFMYGGSSPNAFTNGGSPSISGWDTSSATNISYMFHNCTGFNQPIGNWNTSKVTNMYSMLYNCDAFDQDLSNWIVTGITVATSFMYLSNGLSTTNYDRTLSGWSSQAVQNGVNIHFGGSQYSTATGAAFRSALVASGWTITDGGAV